MSVDTAYRLLLNLFGCLPVKKNKVLFLSYYGAQYGCNPKYLSEYILREHPEWDVVWGFINPEAHSDIRARSVRFLSVRFFYELATSRVFVTNYRMPEYYGRRKGQLYVQTWHSSLRLKAIEADAGNSVPDHYVKMAKHDSEQISLLLSGCEKSSEIFRRAFWYDGEITPTGTPRMDVLFSEDNVLKSSILRQLGVNEGERIVMYAPTFREDKGLNAYNLDLRALCAVLKQKWGGNWKVLLRLHPHMIGLSKSLANGDDIQDVTKYDDIQELLAVSDVVVSDYSSLVFDFAVTGRPCLLYVPDLKDYLEKERKLYFRLEDLPFPIIYSNSDIGRVVSGFDEQVYRDSIKSFMETIGSYENGHACENVYRTIIDHLL